MTYTSSLFSYCFNTFYKELQISSIFTEEWLKTFYKDVCFQFFLKIKFLPFVSFYNELPFDDLSNDDKYIL